MDFSKIFGGVGCIIGIYTKVDIEKDGIKAELLDTAVGAMVGSLIGSMAGDAIDRIKDGIENKEA